MTQENLSYAYDKVIFEKGSPILSEELNTLQELLEILSRRNTSALPSGWLSYRPYYNSKNFDNYFYTQEPEGAKPEIALVNGWPIYVTNTNTSLKHVNKIIFNELYSGSRVDGVFLEVWRSRISSDKIENKSKPLPIFKINNINGIFMYNENIGWAVGDKGIILRTDDGGNNWKSQKIPVNVNINKIAFYDLYTGYAIGNNGVILKSNDGGTSWFILSTNVTDNLKDIYIISDKDICIVGDNGTVLLSNDGTNFNSIINISGTTENLNSVFFFDTNVGWCVGNKGTLLITKNGGYDWQKYSILDTTKREIISSDLSSVVFYNLNEGIITTKKGEIYKTSDGGLYWSNLSDRIFYNNSYKSISEIYPNKTINFNKVFIKKEFTVKFTISVYPSSKNYFKNLSYKISSVEYPNSLVLEYTGTQDNINYINVFRLDQYNTSEELKEAINEVVSPYKASDKMLPYEDREKIRVFEAFIDYEPLGIPSEYKPTSGNFSSIVPARITFSIENKVWIVGDNGVLLYSNNSGAKWYLLPTNIGTNLKDLFFINNNKGWLCGDEGLIVKYDNGNIEIESTDLEVKSFNRIYPEGNILSEAEEYLPDNIINPDIGIKTSERLQIQYRIRVVEGIDFNRYQEAGLGQESVYSLGPNESIDEAGNYTYLNMGEETGDYGLWRAKCRNTYDGYSWAIPMFLVSRRNSAAFNINSNINGSTDFELGAIRPDNLTYKNIIDNDILDIRKQINIQSYSYLLEKNLGKLLSNELSTVMRDDQGTQYGKVLNTIDTYTGINDNLSLVKGEISSLAVLVADQKILDPNIQLTVSELTFGPIENGLYHNDSSYYTAFVARNGEVTTEIVRGVFEGLGTNKVVFHIEEGFLPIGGDLTGVTYVITAYYIDYSKKGLNRVPQYPIAVKYQSNILDPNTVRYFNGIGLNENSKILEEYPSEVEGYSDYVEIISPKEINNNEDLILYEKAGNISRNSKEFLKSINKFNNQQFKGSLVVYHYFKKITENTNIIKIPKIINNYFVFGIKSIKNIDGSIYRINSDYLNDYTIRDKNNTDNDIYVYLDISYTIPKYSIFEIELEVFVLSNALGYTGVLPYLNISKNFIGESKESLASSFISSFDITSKSIKGLYVGVLYQVTVTTGFNNIISIDLTNTEISGLRDGIILGLSSCSTKEEEKQYFAWYKSNDKDYYCMAPISLVEGLGTSNIVVTFDNKKTITSGEILFPIFVKLNNLPNLNDSSVSRVFYNYVPCQTINNLPNELLIEILKCPDHIYITNLGTGSLSNKMKEPYLIPTEQIPVNEEEIKSDNYFSNIDDLEFSHIRINTGFVKMPALISQYIGDDILLWDPNNKGDFLGRTFYRKCSKEIIYQCEDLVISTPRKVFIPFIARIRSKIVYPFLRGELVLVIFSKTYRARKENKVGYYKDLNEEYFPNYYEKVDTAISLYKLINNPLVRK
jgi:photosystem II stability/assembly factor-like uncharacterized protein